MSLPGLSKDAANRIRHCVRTCQRQVGVVAVIYDDMLTLGRETRQLLSEWNPALHFSISRTPARRSTNFIRSFIALFPNVLSSAESPTWCV